VLLPAVIIGSLQPVSEFGVMIVRVLVDAQGINNHRILLLGVIEVALPSSA
jgi:hypothetical protein